MAKAPKQPAPKQLVNEYHVYGDIKKLGDIDVIKKDDGSNVVRLTLGQAQFYIDQGVLGRQPEAETSDETQAIRRQFRGQEAE